MDTIEADADVHVTCRDFRVVHVPCCLACHTGGHGAPPVPIYHDLATWLLPELPEVARNSGLRAAFCCAFNRGRAGLTAAEWTRALATRAERLGPFA